MTAIEMLRLKLTSGNDVPVPRISLTREEAEMVINFITGFREDVTILLNHIEDCSDALFEVDEVLDFLNDVSTEKWNNVTRHLA